MAERPACPRDPLALQTNRLALGSTLACIGLLPSAPASAAHPGPCLGRMGCVCLLQAFGTSFGRSVSMLCSLVSGCQAEGNRPVRRHTNKALKANQEPPE